MFQKHNFKKIVPDDNSSYLCVMGMPNCGQRLLRWQQMTLWFKQCAVMRESCERLFSNESFITVDHIPVMCATLRYFTY